MGILTKDEAKKILDKVLSFSKSDELSASLSGNKGGNIRYARNSVSTSGAEDNITLGVTASFGKRSGTATINEFDEKSLEKVVRRAEDLARLAPENPEAMPALGPQQYLEPPTYFDSTANIDPDYRAQAAADSINPSAASNLTAAGFLNDSANFEAIANTKGLFAYNKSTKIEFSVTVRTSDSTGSGYISLDYNDVSKLDTKSATKIAMDKAANSINAKAIEPGKYTVILEPTASVELLQNMFYYMDGRRADEGRSFLSKAGGKTKLGEKLVDERVNIYSDPTHPEIPFLPFSDEGMPHERTSWIEKGVVQNVYNSRFWAEKKGVKPIPFPNGFIMEGGNESLESMIKSTKKGILVTRLWYIRMVDPQTLLYTGLTRDGTFYIEDGKIKHPVKNFRFNESPVIMLNNLESLGKPERRDGCLVPPMKIRDFTFSSLSDAV